MSIKNNILKSLYVGIFFFFAATAIDAREEEEKFPVWTFVTFLKAQRWEIHGRTNSGTQYVDYHSRLYFS